jgi:hypothetical protein
MCRCKGKCDCNITSTTKGEKGDASPVASLGYKVYKALITQTGTSAPTLIVLQNTIGTITPSYTSAGNYVLSSSGLFTLNKTFQLIGTPSDVTAQLYFNQSDADDLSLYTTSSGVAADGMVSNTSILIEVYP